MHRYYNRCEVCVILKTSPLTVYRWGNIGKIPKPVTIKGKKYYLKEDIDALKDTILSEVRNGPKTGIKKAYDFNNESDVYFTQQPRQPFEYPEMLINFYQPARLNRLYTIDRLTNASE
jgi:predicted DNA-binding transcriptional regulator AlpA